MMNDEENFSALDRQFGKFLQRLAHGDEEVQLAAMCASRARSDGHICVTVAEIAQHQEAPTAATLRKKLRASKVVGGPGEFAPLILDAHDRLYLRRYWEYEQQLAAAILQRTATSPPAAAKEDDDLQKLAATRAVTNNFTVITGGPGTGKTRTVKEILALLLAQPNGDRLRVALAAPTGKAAARLTESVREVNQRYEAATIHRLLGYLPDSAGFRHNAEHPLSADVVIVDEASMVDLALMAKLVAAVPPSARLILLGDRDQLASVEAGSVLADICAAAEGAAPNEPLHRAVVELDRNYRFAEAGGIYRLSRAINAGDADDALAVLREKNNAEVQWRSLSSAAQLSAVLRERVLAEFQPFLQSSEPEQALARLQEFRILCALRHGPFGARNLNALTEEILAAEGLIAPQRGCYRGQPLIITENNYNLGLFNGDSGIILPDPASDNELRAFFLSAEGKLRRLLPARLPQHETAFAMTVHKSQGSEFDRLLLILPDHDTPLLTRELLYTAITRARKRAEIWAPEEMLREAIARRVARHSGLRAALAG